ncbi:MAG: DUF2220 domain-containing protein [Verrucomicrobia bacterium]|nr:DUF2220 domain-containing protein [Verrucomicrobiota bacterium]
MALINSKILSELGEQYRRSKLGRTGDAAKDFIVPIDKLFEESGISDPEEYDIATQELLAAERHGAVTLDRDEKNPARLTRVRVSRQQENDFFRLLGEKSPKQERLALSDLFESYVDAAVPDSYRGSWNFWCQLYAQNCLKGLQIAPFMRDKPEEIREIFDLILQLFKWPHASRVELVSGVLCGETSRLDRLMTRLTRVLNIFTDGAVNGLEDFGIIMEPRQCHIHGRVRLNINRNWVDFASFRAGIQIQDVDIDGLTKVEVNAPRCVVVQKPATFHELVKLNCGDLLILSAYPNEPTVTLIQALPAGIEYWFFGNSDAQGFDILRDLRQKTGKPFQPLHMRYRPSASRVEPLLQTERKLLETLLQTSIVKDVKPVLQDMLESNCSGYFEQETLGVPNLDWFPYFEFQSEPPVKS